MKAPSEVDLKQLKEIGIKVDTKKKLVFRFLDLF